MGADVQSVDTACGPGVQTQSEVLLLLAEAFGADYIGETGYEIAAAKCCSDSEKAQARERGSSLLYGELLPDGVSKVLLPPYLGGALRGADQGFSSNSCVLELGAGSGKVALQIFLQRRDVKTVVGVELVSSRFAIAEGALQRLVAAKSQRFAISLHKPGEVIYAEEVGTGRRIEFHCADFFQRGLDELCESCDAIVFAVNIPCRLFGQLCDRLSKVKQGCRLFAYHSLDNIWWLDAPCPWHQCEANVSDSDTFSTSWSPQGFKFYVYECDHSRPSKIVPQPRNETYSEWQAVLDESSQSYYFHNQENEMSQWEVPVQVGCWQAMWAEEHKSYFFWHSTTNHAQWEAPKCMADLGWVTSS